MVQMHKQATYVPFARSDLRKPAGKCYILCLKNDLPVYQSRMLSERVDKTRITLNMK